MKIFRSAFEAGRWAPASVVSIGKFEGMHRGHRKTIALALRRARALATRCLVLTFDPYPQQVLGDRPYTPMVGLPEKLRLLESLGVDGVVLLPFSRSLACQAPEAFAKDVLAEQLRPMEIYVGADFCFGRDRSGRVETLESLGPELGFSVKAVKLVSEGGEKVSTSRIRKLLDEGKRKQAEALLGRSLP